MVPFGERVWFRRLSESSDRKRSMESKWEEGIWIGHARESNEALIGTPKGITRAWTVRRRVPGERWSEDLVTRMKGIP